MINIELLMALEKVLGFQGLFIGLFIATLIMGYIIMKINSWSSITPNEANN